MISRFSSRPQRLAALVSIVFVILLSATGQGQQLQTTAATRQQLEGRTLMPLAERMREFLVTDGEKEGERVLQSLTQTGRNRWELQLDQFNRLSISRDSDGDVVLHRIDLIDRNQAVVYEPAVTLVPDRIQANVSVREKSRAIVYDLSTGEQTREGTATHSMESITRARFTLPAGQYTGYLVRYEHLVNLTAAELNVSLEIGFVPGEGVVYRRMRYDLEKLGIFGSSQFRLVELAEPLSER